MKSMMIVLLTTILMAQSAPPSTRPADTFDTAEAQKRHVPVQQVLLEKAEKQIADLQKQLRAAQQENQKLKAEATAFKSPQATDAIAEAIKKGQIVVGMTLEQAKQAMKDGWAEPTEETEGSQRYQFKKLIGSERVTAAGQVMQDSTATVIYVFDIDKASRKITYVKKIGG
jgi:hypothetical protein